MDCNPPGSSAHRILQARILKPVTISFSRGSSQPRGPGSPALQADSLLSESPGKPKPKRGQGKSVSFPVLSRRSCQNSAFKSKMSPLLLPSSKKWVLAINLQMMVSRSNSSNKTSKWTKHHLFQVKESRALATFLRQKNITFYYLGFLRYYLIYPLSWTKNFLVKTVNWFIVINLHKSHYEFTVAFFIEIISVLGITKLAKKQTPFYSYRMIPNWKFLQARLLHVLLRDSYRLYY